MLVGLLWLNREIGDSKVTAGKYPISYPGNGKRGWQLTAIKSKSFLCPGSSSHVFAACIRICNSMVWSEIWDKSYE